MRQFLIVTSLVALAVGPTACATKKYVNQRVSDVNDKVTTLSTSLEETQERTRQNEQRIGQVDQKVDQVGARADAAGKSATDARSAADKAGAAADALDKASRRLVYEVVLTEDKNKFKFGHAELSDEAKAEIDKMVETLQQDPKNIYLEIEGHTDSVGGVAVNERLGYERAEAVKRYLYEQHNVPLHKMNVISYGESKPIAPNNTRDGRSQNRRVVIKVLT
jgi:peptidoglycan-associated lipoprotein